MHEVVLIVWLYTFAGHQGIVMEFPTDGHEDCDARLHAVEQVLMEEHGHRQDFAYQLECVTKT